MKTNFVYQARVTFAFVVSGLLFGCGGGEDRTVINNVTVPPVVTNTVVATMNAGVNPAGLAITPDNRFAYVANNNNYGISGANTVSVINLSKGTLETTIRCDCFHEPYTVAINSAGTKAYVTNSNASTISIIDIATNTVAKTVGGFDGPSGFAIAPDGKTAYVNNYGGPGGVQSGNGKTVNVYDIATDTIVGAPIQVGLAPAAVVMSPAGDFVYTINYTDGNPGTGSITKINTKTNQVVGSAITGFSGPFAIALTPNGKFAYVTNFGSNNFSPIGTTVSVVDLDRSVISATINLGVQPSGIAITPDGKYAYVSNYNTLYAGSNYTNLTAGQGTVNVIDTATNTVIAPTIVVGQSPANIAISSDGKFAYVSNYTSGTISVIALH
ncbi:MAG: beta-propeller fold lactonase family protein [Pseudomonadota bacterium]